MRDAPTSHEPKPEDFLEHISTFEITQDQKIELLTCLFEIMRGFVELGYGVNILSECPHTEEETP